MNEDSFNVAMETATTDLVQQLHANCLAASGCVEDDTTASVSMLDTTASGSMLDPGAIKEEEPAVICLD